VSDGVSRSKFHLLENRRHLGAAGLLLDCAQIDIPAANRRKTIFTLRIALQFNRRAASTAKII
jgi:hypothetical protein